MKEWSKFTRDIKELLELKLKPTQIKKKWLNIKKDLPQNYIPAHLRNFFYAIKKYNLDMNSNILDHGCGGANTIFFLISKGYKNVYGLDIKDEDLEFHRTIKKINNTLNIILGIMKEERIKLYDGKKTPYKDEQFDFIFSQQVVEHISNNLINYYFFEEKRVLKQNGIIFHQIPHRLVPFEGHTKRWFIHWLPKKIFINLIGNKGPDKTLINKHLFLEWPWVIKKTINKYFYEINDITYLRLGKTIPSKEFEKKEILLRKILVFLFNIPVIGLFICKLLSRFFMLEIVAYKLRKKTYK